jgi:cysteine desulfurase/selenocysteine lyase
MRKFVDAIRKDFPYLEQSAYGKPLIYFDNAATAQKPRAVIDATVDYYKNGAGNVHRGAHYLSEKATALYNGARGTVARFLNADAAQIVFVRSTTEAINLVATCLAACHFREGDEIILTEMEHHSNIVPWYLIAKQKGLSLKIARVLDDGSIDLDNFRDLFTAKTKLAAFSHASNALGTINPIRDMVKIAKSFGVPTLIDGAQAAPHLPIDVAHLDTDFYCFSGHKVYGPTGIGVLYAKSSWLQRFPPYQGGGDMITTVGFDHVEFAPAPQKFEAGTPNVAGVLGLAAAINYLAQFPHEQIIAHERSLHDHALARMSDLRHVKIVGTARDKVSLISFVIDGVHPHDISSIFDREGIAIRAGHLCAQPLMRRFNVSALSRASFAFYNTREEIDEFINAFQRVFEVFRL